jgi:hypothetical protein
MFVGGFALTRLSTGFLQACILIKLRQDGEIRDDIRTKRGESGFMHDLLLFIDNNKSWIFSGIGVFLIGLLVKYVMSKIKGSKQQKPNALNNVGNTVSGPMNVAGRDIVIIESPDKIRKRVERGGAGRDFNMLSDLQFEIINEVRAGNNTIDKLSSAIGVTNKMVLNLLDGMVKYGYVRMHGDEIILVNEEN